MCKMGEKSNEVTVEDGLVFLPDYEHIYRDERHDNIFSKYKLSKEDKFTYDNLLYSIVNDYLYGILMPSGKVYTDYNEDVEIRAKEYANRHVSGKDADLLERLLDTKLVDLLPNHYRQLSPNAFITVDVLDLFLKIDEFPLYKIFFRSRIFDDLVDNEAMSFAHMVKFMDVMKDMNMNMRNVFWGSRILPLIAKNSARNFAYIYDNFYHQQDYTLSLGRNGLRKSSNKEKKLLPPYIVDNMINWDIPSEFNFAEFNISERKAYYLIQKAKQDRLSHFMIRNTITNPINSMQHQAKLVNSMMDLSEDHIFDIYAVVVFKKWLKMSILQEDNKKFDQNPGDSKVNWNNAQMVKYKKPHRKAYEVRDMKVARSNYLDHSDSTVRQALANNKNLDDELYSLLSVDMDHLVRLTVAINPSTPSSVLGDMWKSMSKDKAIRTALSINENTPEDTLLSMLESPHLDHKLKQEIWLNPSMSENRVLEAYDEALKNNDVKMLRILARNPVMNFASLCDLTNHTDDDVFFSALMNESIPEAMRIVIIAGINP